MYQKPLWSESTYDVHSLD